MAETVENTETISEESAAVETMEPQIPEGFSVPTETAEPTNTAASIAAADKSSYIVGGLILFGAFLIIRCLGKKKKK